MVIVAGNTHVGQINPVAIKPCFSRKIEHANNQKINADILSMDFKNITKLIQLGCSIFSQIEYSIMRDSKQLFPITAQIQKLRPQEVLSKTLLVRLLTFTISVIALQDVVYASDVKECTTYLSGEVDNNMLEKIVALDCEKPTLMMNAIGGESKISLKVAETIASKNIKIIVDSHCLSSCAEFLLPAAKSVEFRKSPVIGFHGNPILLEFLALSNSPPGIENCSFGDANRMRNLYAKSTANVEFWDYQLRFLKLDKFFVQSEIREDACPNMQMSFVHDLWIPSSTALKEDLGLQFSGAVCADQISTCVTRISKIFPKRSYVVGEKVVDLSDERNAVQMLN